MRAAVSSLGCALPYAWWRVRVALAVGVDVTEDTPVVVLESEVERWARTVETPAAFWRGLSHWPLLTQPSLWRVIVRASRHLPVGCWRVIRRHAPASLGALVQRADLTDEDAIALARWALACVDKDGTARRAVARAGDPAAASLATAAVAGQVSVQVEAALQVLARLAATRTTLDSPTVRRTLRPILRRWLSAPDTAVARVLRARALEIVLTRPGTTPATLWRWARDPDLTPRALESLVRHPRATPAVWQSVADARGPDRSVRAAVLADHPPARRTPGVHETLRALPAWPRGLSVSALVLWVSEARGALLTGALADLAGVDAHRAVAAIEALSAEVRAGLTAEDLLPLLRLPQADVRQAVVSHLLAVATGPVA